jgi:hypothetical protein
MCVRTVALRAGRFGLWLFSRRGRVCCVFQAGVGSFIPLVQAGVLGRVSVIFGHVPIGVAELAGRGDCDFECFGRHAQAEARQ